MRRHDVAPLQQLRAPNGVYAIPGNHEYFFDYGAWMRCLSGMGFRMLPNAHAVIERGVDQWSLPVSPTCRHQASASRFAKRVVDSE
ncbi:hypothetical protein QE385_000730 [Sphingomonas sp. SORGH_AS 950]|nr:hypothetical protein [Sphingomonas sp. SORGH_AS_0950]